MRYLKDVSRRFKNGFRCVPTLFVYFRLLTVSQGKHDGGQACQEDRRVIPASFSLSLHVMYPCYAQSESICMHPRTWQNICIETAFRLCLYNGFTAFKSRVNFCV
jgi:hypothetical protein